MKGAKQEISEFNNNFVTEIQDSELECPTSVTDVEMTEESIKSKKLLKFQMTLLKVNH